MPKGKVLMGGAAFLVAFLVVAGLIYWQRTAEEQSLPLEAETQMEAETQTSLLDFDTTGNNQFEWKFEKFTLR